MPQFCPDPRSGNFMLAPTARTPGSCSSVATVSSTVRRRSSFESCVGSVVSATTTPSAVMPGSIARRFTTLRTSNPAPPANRTASAIWPATRVPSSTPPRAPMPEVRDVASRDRRSARHIAMPGTSAISAEAATAMPIDDQNTVQSSEARSASAPSGSDRTRRSKPTSATTHPAAPDTTPIIKASTISCCTSRLMYRAQRGAHRQFSGAAAKLAKHQRRDVDARNREDQRHRHKRSDKARSQITEQVFAHRRDVRRARLVPLRRIGEALPEPLRERLQRRRRGLRSRSHRYGRSSVYIPERRAGSSRFVVHTLISGFGNQKPGGITPTTRCGLPPSASERPTMLRSAPRSRHSE